jgi:hypothetical protein
MWTSVVVLITAVAAIFLPPLSFVVTQEVDYQLHLQFIQRGLDTGDWHEFLTKVPHFLFHLIVVALHKLFPGVSLTNGELIVALGFYVALGLAIFTMQVWFLGKPRNLFFGLGYILIVLALMLVMPVNMLTPRNLYLGYIPIHAYHNPTIVALKPFAVMLFLLAGCIFARQPMRHPWRLVLAAGVLTVLSILAKPNYVLALLPALIICAAVAYYRGQPVNRRLLLWGFAVPASVALSIQALLFSANNEIIIAPLAVMDAWGVKINPLASQGLLLKFFLSILFPLFVYGLYFRVARRSLYLNLAWLTFGCGAAYTYLLAQAGPHLADGNFTWSGQITLLILFMTSVVFFVQQTRGLLASLQTINLKPFGFAACAFAFWLHLWSGVLWYQVHVTTPLMSYIISFIW